MDPPVSRAHQTSSRQPSPSFLFVSRWKQMSSKLERLPDDILLNVIEFVSRDLEGSRGLRATSKRFNILVTPSLFYSFKSVAGTAPPRLARCSALISDISAQKTIIFKETRHLDIDFGIYSIHREVIEPWFILWELLLNAMQSLSSLTWHFAPQSTMKFLQDWPTSIIQAMGSHKTLVDVKLELRGLHPSPQFSLQALSDLHTFSLTWNLRELEPPLMTEVSELLGRCPDLAKLRLEVRTSVGSTALAQLPAKFSKFSECWSMLEKPLKLRTLITRGVVVRSEDFISCIRNFRHLEHLAIELDPGPSSPLELGKIFAILRGEEIHLRRISITSLHPPGIIDYISSYTGLEGFSINSYDNRDDSPLVIDQFLSALKSHCNSLRSLRIDMNRISPWLKAWIAHILENAILFQCLETIESREYLSLEDVQAGNAEPFLRWLEAVMRLPSLRLLRCHPVYYKTGEYYFKFNPDDWLDQRNQVAPFRKQIVETFRRTNNPTFVIENLRY